MAQSKALQRYQEKVAADEARKREMETALADFLADCHYPVSKNGDVMDATYYVALVGYHMVRCGWRRSGLPVIKKRKVLGPGVIEDAVEWVPLNAPDDPLANLENMSVRELAELSPAVRAEAIRRLGGAYDHDLPEPETAWKVTPNITITDEQPSGDDLIGGPHA